MFSLRYTRNLFLRAFCIVYLSAFLSFYIQIPGLFGDRGILPARSFLDNSKHKTLSAKVHYQPTLLWLAPYLGLSTEYALDVLALLGAFLAFTGLVSQKFCTIPLFAGLWSLYFSLFQVGQTFVTRSYDELLLEAGFLAILVAPLLPGRKKGSKGSPIDTITFWLVRWFLFRFFFTTGLKRFIKGGDLWWFMKTFEYYFEMAPLPTPLAWWFHQMRNWKLGLIQTSLSVSEIMVPFLFLVPVRSVRMVAFVFELFVQICTVLTGNYDYSNMLIVTLLLSLVDDQFFYGRRRPLSRWGIVDKLLGVVALGYVAYATGYFFRIDVKFSDFQVDTAISIHGPQFQELLAPLIMYTVYIGLFLLAATVLYTLAMVLFDNQGAGSKAVAVISTIFYSILAVLLFFANTVPLTSLDSTTNSTVSPAVRTAYNRLNKLHVVNDYDFFTKVIGKGFRREIVLEGSNDIEGPWKEYHFLYKPGDVNHSLPFVAPYSPKLDWQMSFAAYNTYEQEPWVLSLAYRLLVASPEVLSLLDTTRLPFPDKPPKYLRGAFYTYSFESPRSGSKAWWFRLQHNLYFPPYSKDSPALVDFLVARRLMPIRVPQPVNPIWKQILDSIRYVTNHLEATLLFWSVLTAGLAVICTSNVGRK